MWQIKRFKTQQYMDVWLKLNGHKIQHNVIYINNGYGLEYKFLRVVY